MEAEDVVKAYNKRQPLTIYDVIKQRDAAREQTRKLMRERDQLQMLCRIAAHYLRYLPLRPEDSDVDMIGRLEAASKGDMDVAGNPRVPEAQPPGPRAPQAEAPAPSVQGDLQPAPAPDRSEAGSPPKEVTLTAAEKKVLKAIGMLPWSYDELAGATGVPRHSVISAVHTLQRFGLVERDGLTWRRA